MADLDFSKIFGETATSKAEFTNENYLKGWGYLGSTPPPYQLFDYLQSQNDKKAKFLYDKVMSYDGQYVPLSGGTMTGNLAINNGTEFSAIELNNTTNGKLLLESMAQNSDSVGHIIYRNGSDTQAKLNIPKKTGTLATLADVPAPVDLNAHNLDVNAHKPITDMIASITGETNWQTEPAHNLKTLQEDAVKRAVDIFNEEDVVITPLVDWDACKAAKGGTDPRTGNPSDQYAYAAMIGNAFYNSEILLKDDFTKFDKLRVLCCDDNRIYISYSDVSTKLLYQVLSGKGYASALNGGVHYWFIANFNNPNVSFRSTVSKFYTLTGYENGGLIEIYGIKYPRA